MAAADAALARELVRLGSLAVIVSFLFLISAVLVDPIYPTGLWNYGESDFYLP
jgi:hypothetical protein